MKKDDLDNQLSLHRACVNNTIIVCRSMVWVKSVIVHVMAQLKPLEMVVVASIAVHD